MSLYGRAQSIGSLNVKLLARIGKCSDENAFCFEEEFCCGQAHAVDTGLRRLSDRCRMRGADGAGTINNLNSVWQLETPSTQKSNARVSAFFCLGDGGSWVIAEGNAMECRAEAEEEHDESRNGIGGESMASLRFLTGVWRAVVVTLVKRTEVRDDDGLVWKKLMRLSEFERCHFLLSLCEEMGVNAMPSYTVTRDASEHEQHEEYVVPLFDSKLSASSTATLKRVLDSRRGGFALLRKSLQLRGDAQVFRHCFERGVDLSVFDNLLRDLENAWLRSQAQSEGMLSTSPEILGWMVRNGFYQANFNRESAIVQCGNKLGLRLLIAEGWDPNGTNKYGDQALTYAKRTPEMIDALLSVGAKIQLLRSSFILPPLGAFRRMLQLRPAETKAHFAHSALLRSGSVLDWVQLMREFDYPAPDTANLGDTDGEIAAALCTFQYSIVRRANVKWEPTNPKRFFWRPWTHYASDEDTHNRVLAALRCFKRTCPNLPRDMRKKLLLLAFGEVRF